MIAIRHSFNLPWPAVFLGVVFYGALSALMAFLARDFLGLIRFALFAFSAAFAFLGGVMLLRRRVFLEVTDEVILFPRGFPRTRVTRIPYAKIIRIAEHDSNSPPSLQLSTSLGNFYIGASYLPNLQAYRSLRDFICEKALISLPETRDSPYSWEGYPKALMRWTEPAEWPRYRTQLVRNIPFPTRLLKALWFLLRCLAIIILPWLALRLLQIPTAEPAPYLVLAGIVALFFTSLHWLSQHWPVHSTEISIRDKGITQNFGKQIFDRSFDDISSWRTIEREFEGRPLHILVTQERFGLKSIALPNSETRDQLAQLLRQKQVPESLELRPPWDTSVLPLIC